jgi:hypothetical protein
MRRRSQIAASVAFIGVLVLPLVLLITGMRPRVLDNRDATEWPSLGGGALLQPETYETIDSFLTDRFPLRDRAIRADAEIKQATSVLDAVRPGVPSGRDGWLYLPETTVDECPGSPPNKFFAAAERVADRAAEADVRFIFAIVPDKAQVYPEHLADGSGDGELPGCSQRWRDAVGEEVDGRPWLVDLFPPLSEAARGSTDLAYFRTDSHWTGSGALVAVERLVSGSAPDVWTASEPRLDGEETEVGDLTALLGLADEETVPAWRVDRPGVEVEVEVEEWGSQSVIRSHATSDGAPLVEGTTVLIGDSFLVGELDLLQPYFEDLVVLRWQTLQGHELADIVDAEPRVVIVQLVARNMANDVYESPLDRVAEFLDAR